MLSNQDSHAEPPRVEIGLKKYFVDLQENKIPKISIGFYVQPISGEKPLFAFNEKKLLTPASITKILTTVAALRTLGAEYRFPTEIFVDNLPKSLGNPNEERVDFSVPPTEVGNLYVRGYGDPSLDSKRLSELAETISQYGITEVNNLVIDDTLFINPQRPSGERPHQAGSSAIPLNYNCFSVFVAPGKKGEAALVSLTPGAPFLLQSKVVTNTLTDDNIAINYSPIDPLAVNAQKEMLAKNLNAVLVTGNIGFTSSLFTQYRTVYNYPEYFSAIFRYYLKQQGIKIKGKILKEEIPSGAKLLHTVESKNLSEIIKDLNQFSNNFIAGQLVYALGQNEQGYFKYDLGLEKVKSVLIDLGYKPDTFTLLDGSGLDKGDQLSAEQIVKVIIDAYNDVSIEPDFISSLSRFGATGTLKKRDLTDPRYLATLTKDELKETKKRATGVWAKTGTLDGASSLAGILQGSSGQKYAFASIINGEIDFLEAKKIEDDLVKILIDLPLEFKENQSIPEGIQNRTEE